MFYKALEPVESQSYRHFLQLRWIQNHRFTDTLLTLLLANTKHLLQHYYRLRRQSLNWSSPGKMRIHSQGWHTVLISKIGP